MLLDLYESGGTQSEEKITDELIKNNYLTESDLQRMISARGAFFITLPSWPEDINQLKVEFKGERSDIYFGPDSATFEHKAEQGAAANP